MPRKKPKRKSPGRPLKAEEDKSVKRTFTLKGEIVAILDAHKVYGFKSRSSMFEAGIISLSRQRAAKTFQSNLIPDKNGVM